MEGKASPAVLCKHNYTSLFLPQKNSLVKMSIKFVWSVKQNLPWFTRSKKNLILKFGRKWPKAEVRCEVEELFYTRLKSFKSLWPKFDSWIDTLKDHSVRVPLRPYGPSRVSIGCWLLRLMVKILVNLRLNFIFYPQWSPEIFQSLIFFRLTIKSNPA